MVGKSKIGGIFFKFGRQFRKLPKDEFQKCPQCQNFEICDQEMASNLKIGCQFLVFLANFKNYQITNLQIGMTKTKNWQESVAFFLVWYSCRSMQVHHNPLQCTCDTSGRDCTRTGMWSEHCHCFVCGCLLCSHCVCMFVHCNASTCTSSLLFLITLLFALLELPMWVDINNTNNDNKNATQCPVCTQTACEPPGAKVGLRVIFEVFA